MNYEELNTKRKKVSEELDTLENRRKVLEKFPHLSAHDLKHSLASLSSVKGVKFPASLKKKYLEAISKREKVEDSQSLERDDIYRRVRLLRGESEVLEKCLLKACVCSCSKK